MTAWPVVILEQAVADIERARDFYDAIQPGLGAYCSASLLADLGRLQHAHGIHAEQFGFRRMLANRFPFGIYYRETPERTEVFAILDLRRDPDWLRAKLDVCIG